MSLYLRFVSPEPGSAVAPTKKAAKEIPIAKAQVATAGLGTWERVRTVVSLGDGIRRVERSGDGKARATRAIGTR